MAAVGDGDLSSDNSMIIALSTWNGAAAVVPVRDHLGALERPRA